MKKTVDGLILRESPIGENDKLLTVLTAEEGRVLMTAKGARSLKSKVLPLCRLFTYANLEYYEKNDRRWLSGGSINDSFFGLNGEIEGFALASYIVQVAAEITDEGVEAGEILRTTLNTLYCIQTKKKPYEQIKAVYEFYAACVSGFCPDLSVCADCGGEGGGTVWLDVMNGSLVCDECLRKRSGNLPIPETDAYSARNVLVPLDASALAALRHIVSAPLPRLFSFHLSEGESMDAFCRAAEVYLINHLERSFDTLDFYHSIKS